MNLKLIVSSNCPSCERALKSLHNIQKQYPRVKAEVININSCADSRISITPAILINDVLFSYGDIDTEKLLDKLNLR